MKRKKLWWLVACLAFALVGLLIFQIRWLMKSAELKENQFKHRVTLALCSAVEELGKDKQVCSALSSCSIRKGTGLIELVGLKNGNHIEATVGRYLNHYQVDTPYEVSLSKSKNENQAGFTQARILNSNNAMIHVDFPSREEFIMSELNGMFITSFALIGLLIVVCVITLQWMFKQQKIQVQTIDYIDGMSHELKTPINNISLALTMLEKQFSGIQSEKVSYYMDVAKKENEALRLKINDVLGTESLASLLGDNKKDLCDVHELMPKAQTRLAVKINEKAAKIECKLGAENSLVYGSHDELLNVLVCLIDNALTYAIKDLRLSITTKNVENKLIISVRDNGVGIPSDRQQQVFEKYYRNDAMAPGHGIGLFLVKKIIESHEGHIELESNPGQGSKFIITLPLHS